MGQHQHSRHSPDNSSTGYISPFNNRNPAGCNDGIHTCKATGNPPPSGSSNRAASTPAAPTSQGTGTVAPPTCVYVGPGLCIPFDKWAQIQAAPTLYNPPNGAHLSRPDVLAPDNYDVADGPDVHLCPRSEHVTITYFLAGDVGTSQDYVCHLGHQIVIHWSASTNLLASGTPGSSGGSGSGGGCTDVTRYVASVVTAIPDGAFSCPGHSSATLTNDTGSIVTCTWGWLVNNTYTGKGTSVIAPGQTIGGTMQGLDSCNTTGIRYVCMAGKDPQNSRGGSCLGNVTF